MQSLVTAVQKYATLKQGVLQAFISAFTVETYEKDEHIIEANQYCRKLWFINKGVLRTYYYQNGKDITAWIYPQKYFVTQWSSFYYDNPTTDSIQAIAPTELLVITKTELNKLYDTYPELNLFGRKMMEEMTAFVDYIQHGFMFTEAKERYDNLIAIYPDILQVANLGHIASMLGMTQETLSRIRKIK